MKLNSSFRFVDTVGRLTVEAIKALQPSKEKPLTVIDSVYQAKWQCQVFLITTTAIDFKRNGEVISLSVSQLVLNPGDLIVLPASQALTVIPL